MYRLSSRPEAGKLETIPEETEQPAPEDIEFSLFGARSTIAPFATPIEFKEIVDMLKELTAQSKAIKSGYRKLQRSKKTDKAKTSTQWSIVALAELVYNLKKAEATWKSWVRNTRLLNLPSVDPLNPESWNTQYKISVLVNNMKKQKVEILRKLEPFFRNGKFVNAALYVDQNWSILPNEGENDIIFNKSKPSLSYVLGTEWTYHGENKQKEEEEEEEDV